MGNTELTLEEKYNEICKHLKDIEELAELSINSIERAGTRELARQAWDYELSYLRTMTSKCRVYHIM